jgi:hypothetical protein
MKHTEVKIGDLVTIEYYYHREEFEVVGIRETELELQGDWSGGTQWVSGKDWYPIDKCKPVDQRSKVIKPDSDDQSFDKARKSIFLAGSIEMGVAEDWQKKLELKLADMPVTVFNPRRDDWDSTWNQRESDPEFNNQVNWEINHLLEADVVFMYFAGQTKSPISLLELGLLAESGKMIVFCPDEFWRKGNVEVVCSRYNIPIFDDVDEAIGCLMTKLKTK